MGLIDFILNIAGLLLWFSWSAIRSDPFRQTRPATLTGTIRRAEAQRVRRWHFLAALGLLLLARGLFYRLIGPAVNWTPKINLAVVVLAFRADTLGPELLFSVLSFIHALLVFYFWLLFLAMINRKAGQDAFQKVLSLQLGRVARWPRWVQAILPLVAIPLLWMAMHPLLARAGVLNPAQSMAHLCEQGLLVGAAIYLSLKFLLPAILFLHVLASYVYFGSSPAWDFIGMTARNILAPLNHLPLRYRRFDFAPLVAIVIIPLALHFLPEIFRNWLASRKIPVWPQ